MQIEKIDYNEVPAISFKDLSYIKKASFLDGFYNYDPDITSFAEAIEARKQKPVDRETLVNNLWQDYREIIPSGIQIDNINALKEEHTFTIITAHQPSLLGGPLYYILKICSTINLCRKLAAAYPEYKFVPIFISGGEDHDFDEIDHLHLFGKTIKWNRPSRGSVGKLNLTELDSVIGEVEAILGESANAKKIVQIFHDSLLQSTTYTYFVFRWINALFGQYGLLMLNMDKPSFKKNFTPLMMAEIKENFSIHHVQQTQELLGQHKFKAQAFPRDINLFYTGHGGRDRIEYIDNKYQIVDTNITFDAQSLEKELLDNPQNFSPNVVMRPLFQECCVPNLAYIGGGGEIAYWLERKSQFDACGVFYPMLIRRNSVMIMEENIQKNIEKLGFTPLEFFQDEDKLIHTFIERNTSTELDLKSEMDLIEKAFENIAKKSEAIDSTLVKAIFAEHSKLQKSIEQMESRMIRTVKHQQESQVTRISKIKQKLFPNNGLQERHDNFMEYYIKYGDEFINKLVEALDPMDDMFYLLKM